MNRMLLVLILLVAGVVGLGFYQRWFHVTSDNLDGESSLTFTVDKNKVEEDKVKAQRKVHDMVHPVKDKAGSPVPPPQN